MRMIPIAPHLIMPHDAMDSEHTMGQNEAWQVMSMRFKAVHRDPDSAVAEQALLSVTTHDGDDINDRDDIDIGADISVVAAISRDVEQLRPEPDRPPQLLTRRRAGQLAVLKVLQQRRTDLDATQLERQRHDFERRSTPDH